MTRFKVAVIYLAGFAIGVLAMWTFRQTQRVELPSYDPACRSAFWQGYGAGWDKAVSAIRLSTPTIRASDNMVVTYTPTPTDTPWHCWPCGKEGQPTCLPMPTEEPTP